MSATARPGKKKRTTKKNLADYAGFILKNYFDDFVRKLTRLSFEKKIPLLKYLNGMPAKQLDELAKHSNREFLIHIAEGKTKEYVKNSLKRWLSDQLPVIERDQVVVEDISLVSHTRKQVFMSFLPSYTKDIKVVIAITKEIDEYFLFYTSAMFKTFIGLLDSRIRGHIDEIEKVNHSLKQAQTITQLGSYVWDLTTNKLDWSEELYRIYEMDPRKADIINSAIIRPYNHPDDARAVAAHIRHSKETLEPFDFHYRIILPDGTEKTLHARGEVIANESGKAVKIFGTAQDVTERQNLIRKLEESEQQYKQAQAITHMGNWDWHVDDNRVTWTDELYRIYGLEPQSVEITLENFIEMVHPEDRALLKEQTRRTLEEKNPGDFFHRIIIGDGSVKILHAKSEALVDTNGKVYKIIGTSQDVTEQKELERKMTEHQKFIHKIADATPSIIASYNIHSGKYIFINEGLKKLLGYEPERVLTEGIAFVSTLIHPEDLGKIMEKNSQALMAANANPVQSTSEEIVEFQYRMRHQNGEYRWFHTFGTVLDRNSKQEVEHVLNISLDITERVKADQTIMQRTAELQQSNASLEEFAFVASHDLKEPLRKIITFSDRLMVKEQNSVSEEGKVYLEKIMNSSIRMQQMISDLLSLSIISTDKTFTQVSLRKLLDEVLPTFEYKIEETKATIMVEYLPDAFVVPAQFRQLFQNLISNSLKFAKQNVPPIITIKSRNASVQEHTTYNLNHTGPILVLEISDNGIGFDNSYVDKIFAVFQRLHQRDSYEGTGIGLAICKKIVENHSGVIVASGVPDQGATFRIIIPREQPYA